MLQHGCPLRHPNWIRIARAQPESRLPQAPAGLGLDSAVPLRYSRPYMAKRLSSNPGQTPPVSDSPTRNVGVQHCIVAAMRRSSFAHPINSKTNSRSGIHRVDGRENFPPFRFGPAGPAGCRPWLSHARRTRPDSAGSCTPARYRTGWRPVGRAAQ